MKRGTDKELEITKRALELACEKIEKIVDTLSDTQELSIKSLHEIGCKTCGCRKTICTLMSSCAEAHRQYFLEKAKAEGNK